jgi:hypothetical protein
MQRNPGRPTLNPDWSARIIWLDEKPSFRPWRIRKQLSDRQLASMPEMPDPCKHHRHPQPVRRRNHVLILH